MSAFWVTHIFVWGCDTSGHDGELQLVFMGIFDTKIRKGWSSNALSIRGESIRVGRFEGWRRES